MELPRIEEFEESDLLFDGASGGADSEEDEALPSRRGKVEDESSSDFEDPEALPRNSMDIVPNSGSVKSTMLTVPHEMFEEDLFDPIASTSHRPSRARAMASSLPVSSSNILMGSSVPMNIPMYGKWKKEEDAAAAAKQGAAGQGEDGGTSSAMFVPPHQLSQQQTAGFAFSLATGESLATMKRDRLRTRNAILKSTGFLEEHAHQMASSPVHERNRFVAGGLSQALQGAAQ